MNHEPKTDSGGIAAAGCPHPALFWRNGPGQFAPNHRVKEAWVVPVWCFPGSSDYGGHVWVYLVSDMMVTWNVNSFQCTVWNPLVTLRDATILNSYAHCCQA